MSSGISSSVVSSKIPELSISVVKDIPISGPLGGNILDTLSTDGKSDPALGDAMQMLEVFQEKALGVSKDQVGLNPSTNQGLESVSMATGIGDSNKSMFTI